MNNIADQMLRSDVILRALLVNFIVIKGPVLAFLNKRAICVI